MASDKKNKGIPIPSSLVEFILLGPLDDRRQLQDSPILGDVWVEFARQPAGQLELLIAPYRGQHAGAVAAAIDKGLGKDDTKANISYLQGIVAATLSFKDVLRVVVPKTKWWVDRKRDETSSRPSSKKGRKRTSPPLRAPIDKFNAYDARRLQSVLHETFESVRKWHFKETSSRQCQEVPAFDRFAALAGLFLWAAIKNDVETGDLPANSDDQISFILDHLDLKTVAKLLSDVKRGMLKKIPPEPLVWQVSLNRKPILALTRSIPAVKADAAKQLFQVDCSRIGWAVLDSGIDGSHPAFIGEDKATPGKKIVRVKRAFDFMNIRQIVSLSNLKKEQRKKNARELLKPELLKPSGDVKVRLAKAKLLRSAEDALFRLADDARNRRPVHWALVERFVEIKPDTPPVANHGHGTHVAGIIGASKAAALKAGSVSTEDCADGMCPDISLFDFRVLGRRDSDTEFAIIAALQFINYLNERDNLPTIHGANLSLSIPHDVRNFACGRTPICDECERLVEGGVVVVAAAGNHGYKTYETKEGAYASYAAFSITDPGNADGVITVGATHRFWPHTYGVSFFSSRGPTGDGRLKPDLVAPGERIRAPLPGADWGDLDGTSMAAPHVSGAAAMLMARYSELIGRPRRVKQILCDSATDLGRERSFQGRGMLDVLRAFQSI